MNSLTPLERQVIEMLLAGDHPTLAALREQARHASVIWRQLTGAGFYTELLVPCDVARPRCPAAFKLGDVEAAAIGAPHLAGFLLYIENGAISMLEGYTYDHPWPKDDANLQLSYTSGLYRDFLAITGMLDSLATEPGAPS